ncbi:AMP-binding protein [Spongiactinospora sp. TRM90649]|uniref:AMP-binding protein n=1 Tax=Spongiactinospora sp. TRM90649 TaxID=3031114 RepID=UPI0023F8E70F|nr:AMP-binding protein [Spongiactinospora sp. TRM90649]MDF5757163.1 AMP-binding protein [Spongiactinospora sp. TRM90649]
MHALVLPPGPAVARAVRDALGGDGPAVLPLSPALPATALRAALTSLRPTHLVDGDGMRALPGGLPVAPEISLVIATSGSTGTPKGVELSASALRASAEASLTALSARDGLPWLCCLPVDHISGLQVLVRAMVGGTEPIVHAGFSPQGVLRAVRAAGAAHVSLVPTQLRRLLALGADLSCFRTILLGGAAAPPGLIDEARTAGARVVTSYGSSETSGGCVYDGRPLYNVDLKVGDDGRIHVAGPTLFSGYRLRPDLTAAVREGPWFVTSDLGELTDTGLRVTGRADDVINTGGEKVVAAVCAATLARHPAVADIAVVGRPDPEWGERVVAVVVPADPASPPGLAELRAFAKRHLPAHAAPAELVLMPELPLLPNGKPDLRVLRQPS